MSEIQVAAPPAAILMPVRRSEVSPLVTNGREEIGPSPMADRLLEGENNDDKRFVHPLGC